MLSRALGLGLLGAVLLAAVGYNPFTSKFRVRWSVTIATPDGIRTGSSVLEVWAYRQGRIGEASGNVFGVRGGARRSRSRGRAAKSSPPWTRSSRPT